MNFSGFFRGRSKKASSEGSRLDFELLYQLSYMSAAATAGIPRDKLFQLASSLPVSTSGYFHDVHHLAQTMNYPYAEACRVVGESTAEPRVKSLMLRLSSSLATGEPPTHFLNREADIQAESYANTYERDIESLRKWTDAYVSLMVAVALIFVISAISTVIYDMGRVFVTGLAIVVIAVSGLGCWVIYRTAPDEVKILAGPRGRKSQRVPHFLVMALLPGSLATGALLAAAGASIGLVLATVGAILFPIGVVSWRLTT